MDDSELYLKATIDAKGAKVELDNINKKAAQVDKDGTKHFSNLAKNSKNSFTQITNNAQKAGSAIAKGFGGAFKGISGVVGGFARTIRTASIAMGIFTAGVGLFANTASDVDEETNKLSVIFSRFGQSAIDAVNKVVELNTATGAFSELGAKRAVSTLADIATGMGLTGDEAVKLVEDFTPLAADIASFKNVAGGATQVIGAFNAALVGEREPLKRLGIVVTEETLKQKALAEGYKVATGGLTAQQKAMLTHKIIMEQTSNAQGDFVRTSDGLANSMRIAQNVIQDISTTIGRVFIPIVSPMLASVTETGKQFNLWAKSAEGTEKSTSVLSKALATLWTILEPIKVILDELIRAFTDIFVLWDDSSAKSDEYGQSVSKIASVVEFISDTIVAAIRIIIDGTGQIIATIDILIKAMDVRRWGGQLKKDYDSYTKYLVKSGASTAEAIGKLFEDSSKKTADKYKQRQADLQKSMKESLSGGSKVQLDLGMTASDIKNAGEQAAIAEIPISKLKKQLSDINLTNTKTGEQLKKNMSDYISTMQKLKEEGYELTQSERMKLELIKETLPLLDKEKEKRQGLAAFSQLSNIGARGTLKFLSTQIDELEAQANKAQAQAKAQKKELDTREKTKNQITDKSTGRVIYAEEFNKLSKDQQAQLYKEKDERLRMEQSSQSTLEQQYTANIQLNLSLRERIELLKQAQNQARKEFEAFSNNQKAINEAIKSREKLVKIDLGDGGELKEMKLGDAIQLQFEQAQKFAAEFFDKFNEGLGASEQALSGVFSGIGKAAEGEGAEAATAFVNGFSPAFNAILPGLGTALSAVTGLITGIIDLSIKLSQKASKERTKQIEAEIIRQKTELEAIEIRLEYLAQRVETIKTFNDNTNKQYENQRKQLEIELLKSGKSELEIEKELAEFDTEQHERRLAQIDEEISYNEKELEGFRKEYERVMGKKLGAVVTKEDVEALDAELAKRRAVRNELQGLSDDLKNQDFGKSVKGKEEKIMDDYLRKYNEVVENNKDLGLQKFNNPGNWGAQDKKEFEQRIQQMMGALGNSAIDSAKLQDVIRDLEELKGEALDITLEELKIEKEKAKIIEATIDKQNALLDRISRVGGNINTVREMAFANLFQKGVDATRGLNPQESTQIGTQIIQTVSNNLNIGVSL